MEVLRKESKSGKVFRIYDNNPTCHIYEIEFLTIYKNEDGSPFYCWKPAFEPKNKLFSDLDKAKAEFEKLLLEN